MNFKNMIIPSFKGKRYYILIGKPIGDGSSSVYLMTPVGEKDFSLWNFQPKDNGKFSVSQYKENDYEELMDELLEEYIATALDEYE